MLTIDKEKEIRGIDWEFVDADTSYATHNLHRYSSKYIPQIAKNLITAFSKKNDTVLDTFVGSGTTLVECKLLSRNSIGIDMNPLAYLISMVKVTKISDIITRCMPNILSAIRNDIHHFRRSNKNYDAQSILPYFTNSYQKLLKYKKIYFDYIDSWFQPQVIEELCIIREHLSRIKDENLKKLCICGFSGILRSVSNAKTDYGNLMVDKERRKIKNTFEVFEKQIAKIVAGLTEFSVKADDKVFSKVYLANSNNIDFIPSSSIDLIVTHPPYIGAVPYAEYQKLSLNWLRESFPEIIQNGFSKYLIPKELDKDILGGRRRDKNVVARFYDDMKKILREMHRVLKKTKFCCIVIGNPVVFGERIELHNKLKDFGREANLIFEQEIIRGKYRTTMGKMKEEYILIFKK